MKIQKKDSNYDIEISAEEITSVAGLLKNDNAMDVISAILRYFQIQTDRTRFEESLKEQQEEELTKIEPEKKEKEKEKEEEKEEDENSKAWKEKNPGYFIGIPAGE